MTRVVQRTMNGSRSTAVLLLLGLTFFLWQPAVAQEEIQLKGRVTENDQQAQLVTVEPPNGSQWHVPWSDTTTIQTMDDAEAAFADLTAGMFIAIRGTIQEDAERPNTVLADTIQILDAGGQPPAARGSEAVPMLPETGRDGTLNLAAAVLLLVLLGTGLYRRHLLPHRTDS